MPPPSKKTEFLRVAPRTFVPITELRFTFDRSRGPGGQNVNKRSSRATLWFDVLESPSLTDHQKSRLQKRLETRINKEGILRMVASKFRTQAANRRVLLERFVDVVSEALTEKTARKKTRTPKSVKRKRANEKRHKSRLKDSRKPPARDD